MSSPNSKRAITGLVIVLIGLFFLFDNLGFGIDLPGWIFTWPMIFVIIGLINVFNGNLRAAFIFISIGALFYLQVFDIIDIRTYWPVFLIIVGLALIFRNRDRRNAESNENYFDEVSIFGGTEKKFISDQLEGGKITNIFGGSDIDLRGSKAVDGAEIEVFTLFGGCDIQIPSDWKLNVNATAIFGGFSDSRSNIDPKPTSTVTIKGFTMFGGGDIKN